MAAARRGVSWTTLSVGFSALAGVLQLAIAARFLSRGEFGQIGLILLMSGIAQQLSDLGTANAVLHRQRAPHAELESLHWLNAIVGIGLFVLVAATGPVFAFTFEEPGFHLWLPLAATVLLLSGCIQVPLALLRRELRFRAVALVEISGAIANLAVVSVLLVLGAGVVALLLGQIAWASSRLAVCLVASRPLFRPRPRFSASEVKPYLSFGVYQLGERLLNFASWNIDKAVIGVWLGPEALGAYHLAYRLVIRPFEFVAAMSSNVTRSLLARIQSDRERLVRGYLTSVRLAALLALPLYVGAFVTAQPLVTFLYGPGWEDVAEIFVILCPLGALYTIGNPVGGLVVATGKARVSFLWNVFTAAVSLVAVGIGARYGAHGIATAMLVATAGVLFPCGFILRWVLVGLSPKPFLACLGRPLAYAMIMGFAIEAGTRLTAPRSSALEIAFAAICGVTVYAALIWTHERPLVLSIHRARA